MSIKSQNEISAGIVNTPMLWVNEYLKEKLADVLDIGIPFFPPTPGTIDDLTETFTQIGNTSYPYAGIRCTYDRLTRLRKSAFPHIKNEQLLYYFFATASNVTENMVAATEMVLRLMDREDETAEEINDWSKDKTFGGLTQRFYFHRFRVYQLEETADIIDFGTARTYGGNKIIIEYEYHIVPESNPSWNDPKYPESYNPDLPLDPNRYLPIY
jgi:hypothetical protein